MQGRGDASLVDREGLKAIGLLSLPPTIAALALLARRKRPAVVTRTVAAVLILAFAIFGAASIGMFFIPSGVLMGIAAFRASRG